MNYELYGSPNFPAGNEIDPDNSGYA